MKNAGKACNNRLYRHIRTFEKIVKNYFVIYHKSKSQISLWCCTIKVDIENSKSQYIEKDKQEATKDGSESTKIQHGI